MEKFSNDVLRIIEEDPEKISKTIKINVENARQISETFKEKKESQNILSFLASFDIPINLSLKIYREYKIETIEILKSNPYRISEDIWGVGFKTADRIALSLGTELNSNQRISAGIYHTLKNASERGHLFLAKIELIKNTSDILGVDAVNIEDVLLEMIRKNKLISENDDIFLIQHYNLEINIAKRIIKFLDLPLMKHVTEKTIEEVFKNSSLLFDSFQLQAIKESQKEGLLIVTGGHGTGKTTTINNILKIAELKNIRTILACPTGRAAKRLSETCLKKAKTIHRLLEYSPGTQEFKKNKSNPINADLIIIDETSMVDVYLFNHLLDAIKEETRLILIGDYDQLPPVGPGNILKDLIYSSKVKTVFLQNIFRQGNGSSIITNSHLINEGKIPVLNPDTDDFYFYHIQDPENILKKILELFIDKDSVIKNFDPIWDIQILSPVYKGLL